jgi:pimeloyl-ACP methyl ester carboxylesterase
MPVADLGNVKIYYEIHGEGYPLLMIQGFSCSSEDWNQVEPRASDLSRHFKVILIDSRGTGRSSAPPESYKIRDMADDAAALLDYLKIPRAHILGASMGGMIAQEVAINHPGKVNGLMLLNTGPGGKLWDLPGQRENGGKLTWTFNPPNVVKPADVQAEIMRLFYYRDYLAENRERIMASSYVYPTPTSTLEKQYNAIAEFDTTSRLGKIKARTLILHGEDDLLIFPEAARYLSQHIKGSELHIFEKTGHAVSEERWAEIKPIMIGFLGKCSV